MLSVVATRYAKALADVVTSHGAAIDPAVVLSELQQIEAVMRASVELRNALMSPAVSPSKKRAVMARLIAPLGASKQVRNFVFVVIDHRRTHELASIVEAFEQVMDERLGFVRADVSSAHDLNDAQRAALAAELSRLSGRKARPRFSTDPSLVGGVVARVGSTVYDGSVRGQLERLCAKLASA